MTEKTRGYILSEICKTLPSHLDCESLAQDLWLKATQTNVQPTKRFIRWRCINEIRKAKRYSDVLESYKLQDTRYAPTVEPDDQFLAPLTPIQRSVISLHFYDRETMREVAKTLGLPLSSVLYHKRCALRTLKTKVQRHTL